MDDYSPVTPPAADHECLRCRVALVPGYAYVEPLRLMREVATDEDFQAKLVKCRKCPACGYSEKLPA